jgi:hypothetical protein
MNYFDGMTSEDRIKVVKHRLVDMGISLREWCRRNEVSYSVVRDIIYGRLDGSKAEKTRLVKEKLAAEFDQNLF